MVVQNQPADFHLHFEGCLFPATLDALGGKGTASELALKRGNGLAGFLDCLRGQLMLIKTDAGFNLAFNGFRDYLHEQKLARAEVFFSPLIYDRIGYSAAAALEILAARWRELPAETILIFDTVRQFGPGAAEKVVALAADWRERLPVRALGMGGDEDAFPAREFRTAYDEARKLGLGLTCHAGEAGEARNIWEAIDELGVTRIGHGLAAADDSALMERMRRDDIAIECCPESNLALGLVESFALHPLHLFIREKLALLPGADDPAVFGADSRAEFTRLAGLIPEDRLAAVMTRHAFTVSGRTVGT